MCTSNKKQRNVAFEGNLGMLAFDISVGLSNRAELPPVNTEAFMSCARVADSVVCDWLYTNGMDPSHIVLSKAQLMNLEDRVAYAIDIRAGMAGDSKAEV